MAKKKPAKKATKKAPPKKSAAKKAAPSKKTAKRTAAKAPKKTADERQIERAQKRFDTLTSHPSGNIYNMKMIQAILTEECPIEDDPETGKRIRRVDFAEIKKEAPSRKNPDDPKLLPEEKELDTKFFQKVREELATIGADLVAYEDNPNLLWVVQEIKPRGRAAAKKTARKKTTRRKKS